MMDYILVQNGQIVGYPRALPQNWKDVSNFYLLDNQTLKSYGWFPVRFVPANKTENDIVTGQRFEIEKNEVVQYEEIRTKTETEIEEEINSKWETIRMERNRLLSECDWTQLPDVLLTPQNIQEWVEYRKQLRNITNTGNPNEIIWPTKPEVITQ